MASDEARQQYEFYSAQYARFGSDIAVEIRREVYGEDQGQQGWRTLDEQAQIAALIDRRPCHVLGPVRVTAAKLVAAARFSLSRRTCL